MDCKEYKTKSGKPIRLWQGDCMDFMQGLEENDYDLCIVDPPYGIGADKPMGYKSSKENKDKWGGSDWDTRPEPKYFEMLSDISNHQIVWGGNYFTELWDDPTRGIIIWDKVNRTCFGDGELAWTSFDKPIRIYEYSASNLQGFRNPDRFHPTEKPVDLYRWILTNYATEYDTILDTHGGSMSLAIACYIEDYELDIIELDKDYYNDAVKRFEQHISQKTLF